MTSVITHADITPRTALLICTWVIGIILNLIEYEHDYKRIGKLYLLSHVKHQPRNISQQASMRHENMIQQVVSQYCCYLGNLSCLIHLGLTKVRNCSSWKLVACGIKVLILASDGCVLLSRIYSCSKVCENKNTLIVYSSFLVFLRVFLLPP